MDRVWEGKARKKWEKKSNREIRHNWRHKTHTHTQYCIHSFDSIRFFFLLSSPFILNVNAYICLGNFENFFFGRILLTSFHLEFHHIIIDSSLRVWHDRIQLCYHYISDNNRSQIIIVLSVILISDVEEGIPYALFNHKLWFTIHCYYLCCLANSRIRWIRTPQILVWKRMCR